MRKNVGWQEVVEGVKWEVRVLLRPEGVKWKRVNRSMEEWEEFAPAESQWRELVERMRARYARRQAPYKDVLRVEKAAAAAGVRVEGGYKGEDGRRG